MKEHYTKSDVDVLKEVCYAIKALKRAEAYAVKAQPTHTYLGSKVASLEEWASLWASESGTSYDGDVTEKKCVEVLDAQGIEHRYYA